MSKRKAGRPSQGLSAQTTLRAQPDELQMIRDIAGQLGLSSNAALRWAVRYAHPHATSTDNHPKDCKGISPCVSATKGLSAPSKAARVPVSDGQTVITHQATVE